MHYLTGVFRKNAEKSSRELGEFTFNVNSVSNARFFTKFAFDKASQEFCIPPSYHLMLAIIMIFSQVRCRTEVI